MARRARARRRDAQNQKLIIVGLFVVVAVLLVFGASKVFSSASDIGCGARDVDTDRTGYCSVNSNDFDELVIVVGNTQNSPKPDLDFTTGDLREILAGVFYHTERGDLPRISVVSAATENRTIDFEVKYKPAQNIRASNNALNKLAGDLTRVLQTPAMGAGADYLGGILEANNLFSNDVKNPLILVVGSGYSDNGVLNFAQDNLFERYWQDDENIVRLLADDASTKRPVLKNRTVYWYNLGDTVAPQVNMNKYKTDTQSIYGLALAALGAQEVRLANYSGISDGAVAVDSPYSVMPTFVDELKAGDSFNVNENVGRFEPDRDVLLNELETEERLKVFAQRFNNRGQLKLQLTGYVAICLEDEKLSLARANTIKRILVKLGVTESKIMTRGRRGSPPEDDGQEYTCDSTLPATERRTVLIEVVEE